MACPWCCSFCCIQSLDTFLLLILFFHIYPPSSLQVPCILYPIKYRRVRSYDVKATTINVLYVSMYLCIYVSHFRVVMHKPKHQMCIMFWTKDLYNAENKIKGGKFA